MLATSPLNLSMARILTLVLHGMYPMNGNLNMGNYNIKNATDISYTGWLYGNNAVMNNL